MSAFLKRLFGGGGARADGAGAPLWPPPDDTRIGELVVTPGERLEDAELPRAAIVILNHNGRQHLSGCFESLRGLDYPEDRLEVVLVDNASVDGSVEEMRAQHGWVRLDVNERNVGFSAGCNQGAALAREAQVLVFLNNDMRVEASWLRRLVEPVVRGECHAATAKMYSWDGSKMNSAGGGMNFHGIGIQKGYDEVPGPEHDQPSRTLFACGGAMAIDARVFREVGGFDEEFFAYYEDVDLGWRMWVMGYEIHYVPSAVCYHHHSSTSRTFPMETIRLLQTRNPLLACFKNYDDQNLARVLPAALALHSRRAFLAAGLEDDTRFRIEAVQGQRSGVVGRVWEKARRAVAEGVELRKEAVADMVGLNDLLGRWEHWSARRAEVQSKRQRPDEEILRLFHKPLWCIEEEPSYSELHRGMAGFLGLDDLFQGLTARGTEPNK